MMEASRGPVGASFLLETAAGSVLECLPGAHAMPARARQALQNASRGRFELKGAPHGVPRRPPSSYLSYGLSYMHYTPEYTHEDSLGGRHLLGSSLSHPNISKTRNEMPD